MTPADRPRLRTYGLSLTVQAGQHYLFDQFRIAWPPLPVTRTEVAALQRFSGNLTLAEIQSQLQTDLTDLVARLDDSFYLDSPRFLDYLSGPVRRTSVFAGWTVEDLRAEIAMLFIECGPPGSFRPDRPLKAVLVPHMDYGRGGEVYGHGFKALAERTDASLFVVIATSHYSPKRFTLTRMDFETPLGRVATDQPYIDRIIKHYGDGLFDDPIAHLPEHSIELEVAVMQHLWPEKPFRIVPLLVGSFQDCVAEGCAPRSKPDIARMIEALKRAERDAGEKVCYIISGDLAHIGQKFDDPDLLTDAVLAASRSKDDELANALTAAKVDDYFRIIAKEKDSRRICGLPPTAVALEVVQPGKGEVLAYHQHVHPKLTESVSYASVVFV